MRLERQRGELFIRAVEVLVALLFGAGKPGLGQTTDAVWAASHPAIRLPRCLMKPGSFSPLIIPWPEVGRTPVG